MKLNTTAFSIIALIIAAGAYFLLFPGSGNQPSLTTSASENLAQTKFQSLINNLPLSFDTTILTDPKFVSLVDLSVPVSPEPSGRLDPFAVVPGTPGGRM
ncbi:MAG: hypothetical protein WAW90_03440 [Minisyncoccia bacterium]